jgi:hypothetical protein
MDDYAAIVNLTSQYARGIDACDWDAIAACFAVDAEVEFLSYPPALRGRSTIREFIRVGRERFDITQHVIGSPFVLVDGDRANAMFYVVAQHVVHGEGDSADSFCLLGVDYTDELARTDDGWRVTSRRIRRLWTQGDPAIVSRPET